MRARMRLPTISTRSTTVISGDTKRCVKDTTTVGVMPRWCARVVGSGGRTLIARRIPLAAPNHGKTLTGATMNEPPEAFADDPSGAFAFSEDAKREIQSSLGEADESVLSQLQSVAATHVLDAATDDMSPVP